MHRFDYSFLNNGLLPASLVNLTASIASLKTMAGVRKESNIKVFTELETIAKVQSVKSSNAIEGIVTSDSRIAEIVNGNSAPLNHNEMEIVGYRDALNAIHRGYAYLDFRQVDILRLHEMLMSMTGDEYGGKYKVSDNYILEEDSKGNRRIRSYSGGRNTGGDGAAGACIFAGTERCEYQPAAADSLCYSRLFVHPSVPGWKRQNVQAFVAAASV